MTEDEAKTKWCPFSRQGEVTGFRIVTRTGDGTVQHTLCIGSACMAWRWYETHVPNGSLAQPIANVGADELVRSTRSYGCCGLAGSWFGQMGGFQRAHGSEVR